MPSVFISYSRHDKEFVGRLHEALTARSYDVWVDWEDIPASAAWLEEIRAGVGSADGFIYVISPDSVTSEICTRELDHAAEQHKRIVPVVYREPDGASVPEAAATLNWVFLRGSDEFGAGIEILVGALETDLEHVRTHTRLGVAAGRWDLSGRDQSQLVRGAELTAAEGWLVAVADKQPLPTQLQREFVLASRQAATRRQRTVIGAVSVALVVAVLLGVVALIQRAAAVRESDVAFARQLDANAQNQYATDPELSVLLAARAAQVDPGTITEQALRQALATSHVRERFALGQPVAGDALWSPDGRRLLVTSPGAWARIYRPGSGLAPVSLPPPSSRNQSAWDARGDRVVIGGASPSVYDAVAGKLVKRLAGGAVKAALSRDGTRVVTIDLQAIGHVYDVATGRSISSFRPVYGAGVTCLAWSPNDSVIAQCDVRSPRVGSRAALDTWDPHTGKLLHSVPSPHLIQTAAFSPDSRLYVFTTTPRSPTGTHVSTSALARTHGLDGTFVYGARSGRLVKAFPEPGSVAAFSPNAEAGLTLAYATIGDQLGHVYNFESRAELPLTGHTGVIESIAFNHAGTDVIAAGNDNTARVYDASSGALLEQLAGDSEPVLAAGFGLDDKAIATSSTDGLVRVWTGPDPQPARMLAADGRIPATIGFSSDSGRIVEADVSGHGRILDAGDLHQLATFDAPSGQGFAGAAESHDRSLIATLTGTVAPGGTSVYPTAVVTYDARTGRPLATITPPAAGGVITGANYAGARFATVQSTGAADEWDPRSGRHLESLPGAGIAADVVYSPVRSLLAIAHLPALPSRVTPFTQFGPVTIDLWNALTGERRRTITGDVLESQLVGKRAFAPLKLAFSPDGRILAVSGADPAVELYSTSTGRQIGNLPLNQHFAAAVAFSPDGRYLAAGTAASAFVWRLPQAGARLQALPELQHADSSAFGVVFGGFGVSVGFTADSKRLLTVGDSAVEAWDLGDEQQLFKAFAYRGALSPAATEFVTASGGGVSLYPCELCRGLPYLLALAKRHTTRGFTPSEQATYLSRG